MDLHSTVRNHLVFFFYGKLFKNIKQVTLHFRRLLFIMKITVGRTKARKMGKTIGQAMMVFREKGAYGLDCGSGNLHGEK